MAGSMLRDGSHGMPIKSQSVDADASAIALRELCESMQSLQAEVSRMTISMRSVVHDELEQLYRRLVRQEGSTSPSRRRFSTGMAEPFQMQEHDFKIEAKSQSSRERTLQVMSPKNRPPKIEDSEDLSDLGDDGPLLSNVSASTPLLGARQSTKTQPELTRSNSADVGKYQRRATIDDYTETITASARKNCILSGRTAEEEEIKVRLQQAKNEHQYNVEDFFHKTGLWQRLARQDSWFSQLSLIIVAINVLWIGADTDIDKADVLADAPLISQVMDNSFCVFFTFELMVRFLAFERKTNCCKDGMFLFDACLVAAMVWETWIEVVLYLLVGGKDQDLDSQGGIPTAQIFRFFRLFRLTRVPRIVKLSVEVPELMVLLKGMAKAMRSVGVILFLLVFVIFIFAILFTELLSESPHFGEAFPNVLQSMNTLLLQVLCGPDPDFINLLLKEHIAYYFLYLVFIFWAVLTMMNMLIGVLCDVVSGVSSDEKDNMEMDTLETELDVITSGIDLDNDGIITKWEFEELMQSKTALKSLDRLGVDVVAFGGLSSFIFVEGQNLSLAEFCRLIGQFRGGRTITVKDLMDTRRFITTELDYITKEVRSIHETVEINAERLAEAAAFRNQSSDAQEQSGAAPSEPNQGSASLPTVTFSFENDAKDAGASAQASPRPSPRSAPKVVWPKSVTPSGISNNGLHPQPRCSSDPAEDPCPSPSATLQPKRRGISDDPDSSLSMILQTPGSAATAKSAEVDSPATSQFSFSQRRELYMQQANPSSGNQPKTRKGLTSVKQVEPLSGDQPSSFRTTRPIDVGSLPELPRLEEAVKSALKTSSSTSHVQGLANPIDWQYAAFGEPTGHKMDLNFEDREATLERLARLRARVAARESHGH